MSSETIDSKAEKPPPNRPWVLVAIRQIQQDERVEENFELLFREYEPAVRRRLQFKGFRGAELDDLVQDVMLRVYRGIPSFRLDASFNTWTLTVMQNAAKNAHRDLNTGKARATRASLDSLLDSDSGPRISEPESPRPGPLDDTLATERKTRLLNAIEELPARMRQCLLFRYQGYQYREIAEVQGVSVATVKKQVSQGHRRLRPILGQFVDLFGVFLLLTLLLV